MTSSPPALSRQEDPTPGAGASPRPRRRSSSVTVAALLAVAWCIAFGAALVLDQDLRDSWRILLVASIISSAVGVVAVGVLQQSPSAPTAPSGSLVSGHLSEPLPRPVAAGPPPPTVKELPPGRRLRVEAFTTSKAGSSDAENEDAWAAASDSGVACVSDGASSSFQSGAWARLLCSDFVVSRPAFDGDSMAGWLLTLAQRFQNGETEADGVAGWWDEGASTRGSYATFAGVVVRDSEHGPRWSAVAVGDSTVLHLRPDGDGFRLVSGFPIELSSGFEGSPQLVGSLARRVSDLPSLRFAEGGALADDVWVLATDETAHWALSCAEAGAPIWSLLVHGHDDQRHAGIAAARESGAIVNDDMTFAVVSARLT